MPSQLFSQKQAAEFLGISQKTLTNWRYQSRGPAYVKLGTGKTARISYLKEDIDNFLLANRVIPVLSPQGGSHE